LPRPEYVSLAELLLRKAESDLAVARVLAADPDPHDDAIGFHAQQAVEKALKAVLALEQIEAPLPTPSHDRSISRGRTDAPRR
jgi:HEPN domain-containing protein